MRATIEEVIEDFNQMHKTDPGYRILSRISGAIYTLVGGSVLTMEALTPKEHEYLVSIVASLLVTEGLTDLFTAQHHYLSLRAIKYVKQKVMG